MLVTRYIMFRSVPFHALGNTLALVDHRLDHFRDHWVVKAVVGADVPTTHQLVSVRDEDPDWHVDGSRNQFVVGLP
jgi:hypothetical protein